MGGPQKEDVYENETKDFNSFNRTTTRPGCHSSDDDNENYVADTCVTTDSDAEDLEQLVDDSRRALRLTITAFDEAKRLVAADALDTVVRRGSGGINDGVVVDGSGFRQPHQPKLVSPCVDVESVESVTC